ncbi:hypothetical protein PFISCL1PPCAC_1135, partial [Pristionchus fissidentatus]
KGDSEEKVPSDVDSGRKDGGESKKASKNGKPKAASSASEAKHSQEEDAKPNRANSESTPSSRPSPSSSSPSHSQTTKHPDASTSPQSEHTENNDVIGIPNILAKLGYETSVNSTRVRHLMKAN